LARFVWKKSVGGEYMDAGICIQEHNSNYFIAGYKDAFGTGFSDFWLFKFIIEEK